MRGDLKLDAGPTHLQRHSVRRAEKQTDNNIETERDCAYGDSSQAQHIPKKRVLDVKQSGGRRKTLTDPTT